MVTKNTNVDSRPIRTVEDVRLRAAQVEAELEATDDKLYDPEAAHDAEDQLYYDLLQSIADGTCEDPAACAAEALKTQELDFPRWRA